MFVDQILVVCIHDDFVTEEYVALLLEGFHDAEQLSLSCGVPSLSVVQFSTVERDRFIVLGDYCSQLVVACIRVDDKRFAVVGVCQHDFSSHDALSHFERRLLFRSPFPLLILGS